MSMTRSNNTTPVAWFAVGRCQHGKEGCHEARFFGQRATIVSPVFETQEELKKWLKHKDDRPSDRRCRNCLRPIDIKHFERRSALVSTSDMIDDSVHA